MYRSKQKALKMYIDPKTREDFLALSDVMLDVAFLPEYIDAQFSSRGNMKTRNRFGGLRVVRLLIYLDMLNRFSIEYESGESAGYERTKS
jgi:hypothetical protein